MSSGAFLKPILEDVPEGKDIESQTDNLLSPQTYSNFTPQDWFQCFKFSFIVSAIVALVILLIYISVYSFKNH